MPASQRVAQELREVASPKCLPHPPRPPVAQNLKIPLRMPLIVVDGQKDAIRPG